MPTRATILNRSFICRPNSQKLKKMSSDDSSPSPVPTAPRNPKTGFDPKAARKQRERVTIELRASKRAQCIARARARCDPHAQSESKEQQEATLLQLRTALALLRDENPFGQRGAIPTLLECLKCSDSDLMRQMLTLVCQHEHATERIKYWLIQGNEQEMFQCLWIVTNMCSSDSEFVHHVCHSQMVPLVCKHLHHPNKELVTQALWCLGNVCADSEACRDHVLEQGTLATMLQLSTMVPKTSGLAAELVFVLSNMVWKQYECLPVQDTTDIVRVCTVFLDPDLKEEVLMNAFKTLKNITLWGEHDADHLRAFTQDVCKHLIMMLRESVQNKPYLLQECLLCISNLMSVSSEVYMDRLMREDVLPLLAELASGHILPKIRQWSMLALSNVCAGTSDQVQQALRISATFYDRLETERNLDVKKEAAYALCNLISDETLSPTQRDALFQLSLPAWHATVRDYGRVSTELLHLCLESLHNYLLHCHEDGYRSYVALNLMEECGLQKEIEQHQTSENKEVRDLVSELQEYFDVQADAEQQESDALAPQETTSQFVFGT